MDMPVNVPVDDPNADTEWNDILRQHGVIPQKPPSPTPMIEEALEEARRLAHENRLESKDLDELAELEDEEDDAFLEEYRKKRLVELSTISKASVFNQVYHLQKPDYAREVTETSRDAFVFVLLASSQGANIESRLLIEMWRELAGRFGDVKFCQMRADMCIEGYPERNTPTVLIYRDGDIRRQIVTLRELQGSQTTRDDFEKLLQDIGAVDRDDPRFRKGDRLKDKEERQGAIRSGVGVDDDEEGDWD